MTLLVIQEQHFTRLANGQVWVNETSNIQFWERYLNVFDRIVVCARVEQRANNNHTNLMRSDRDEVSFIPLPNFRGTKGLLLNIGAIRRQIKKAIEMANCIIFRAPSPISLVAYPIVKKSDKPFAVELMNNPVTQYSKESMNSVWQPIIQRIVTNQTKEMCIMANGVSYVTEKTLQKLYPCQAHIQGRNTNTYFTAHYSTIRLNKEDYSCKEIDNILPRPLVLVNAGKMNDYRKGQDILIQCVKALRDRGHDVELKLIGTGLLESEFQLLAKNLGISDFVYFEGWKTGYHAVQDVLQSGHLFVFPSMGEGLPRSVIEAMANGLIPIASAVDGTVELLPPEMLVNKFNAEAFTDKIEEVIKKWSQYVKMREKTFQKSHEYEDTILKERRNAFYTALCNVEYGEK